jgi:putative transposase
VRRPPDPADAQIKTVTIKRDVLGNLYACFSLVVPDPKPAPTSGKVAGFDFGLKMFLTRHDGQQIPSPEFFKVGLTEIAKLKRSVSRKVKGSNHWHQAKRALAKAHMAIANKRRDWFFKLAHRLTDEYDVLCFEDLNLRGMVRLWGRQVSDLAFATFVTILQFVAQKKGKQVVFVHRFYPSSKRCSHCGHIKEKLELGERRWRCPSCQAVVDRDENAACNIQREGANSLARAGVRQGFALQPALTAEPHALLPWAYVS